MRTTVTLDQDVYEKVLRMSRMSGERMGKVLSDLARKGMQPPAAPHRNKSHRFPIFDVPPGTPMMSAEKIQQIIDDEDI